MTLNEIDKYFENYFTKLLDQLTPMAANLVTFNPQHKLTIEQYNKMFKMVPTIKQVGNQTQITATNNYFNLETIDQYKELNQSPNEILNFPSTILPMFTNQKDNWYFMYGDNDKWNGTTHDKVQKTIKKQLKKDSSSDTSQNDKLQLDWIDFLSLVHPKPKYDNAIGEFNIDEIKKNYQDVKFPETININDFSDPNLFIKEMKRYLETLFPSNVTVKVEFEKDLVHKELFIKIAIENKHGLISERNLPLFNVLDSDIVERKIYTNNSTENEQINIQLSTRFLNPNIKLNWNHGPVISNIPNNINYVIKHKPIYFEFEPVKFRIEDK